MAWGALEKGDIVDIVAPGYRSTSKVLKDSVKLLKKKGFTPRVANDLFGPALISSNSIAKREKTLWKALAAKDSKAVWCLRGGFGSIHLLPFLSQKKPLPEKLFIGLSDITSLHVFLERWGWSTLHGPVLERVSSGDMTQRDQKELWDVVLGHKEELSFRLMAMNKAAKKKGRVSGKIVGGNLVTLSSTLGTPYQIRTKGKILFVEEVAERAYRIDRLFTQIEQAGLFKGLKGLVLGDFTACKEPNGKDLTRRWLKDFAEAQSFPVLSGIGSGHGKRQRIVPFGTKSEILLGVKPEMSSFTGVK